MGQGGIQTGTTATSIFSKNSEKLHIKWINEVFSTLGSEWSREKSLPISEGSDQVWESDGGWIYHNRKLVGVAENKWQTARNNAVERGFRYLTEFDEAHRIFISCSGPGFAESQKKGSTDAFIIRARKKGIKVLVNVIDEQEFKSEFTKWLNTLI